jgi:hypothetical protein
MRYSLMWLVVGSLVLAGCGGYSSPGAGMKTKGGAKDKGRDEQDRAGHADGEVAFGAARGPAAGAQKEKKPEPRKIIYTGRVELVVQDFEDAIEGMDAALKDQGGYVSSSEVTGEPGQPRSGQWTLRIPVDKFATFLKALGRLGELRNQRIDSEDVTDRYFDTKAEVANLEVREEALRKLYKEKIAGSKLTDLLEVDRELNNVRGQINLRKGQLQRWDKLVEYATVTLTIRDRKGYVPPESPNFRTRIGRTFQGSIDALVAVGKALVLTAVALAPWMGVLLVFALAVWIPVRLFAPRRKHQPPPPPAVEVVEAPPEPPAP